MPFPKTPSYSLGVLSGTMAAGLAGAAPIVSIRWAMTDAIEPHQGANR